MSDGPLRFSTAELALLARMAGEVEPVAEVDPPPLDQAGWEAVANGLAARGLMTPAGEPTLDEATRAALGVRFTARDVCTVMALSERGNRTVTFHRADGVVVEDEESDTGLHTLRGLLSDDLPGRVIAAAALPSNHGAPGPETRVDAEAFGTGVHTLNQEGLGAAVAALPAADGYFAALERSRSMTVVERRVHGLDDAVTGASMTVVVDADGSLWMDSSSDDEDVVTVQRLPTEAAQAAIERLVGSVF